MAAFSMNDKDAWHWTMMIMVPEWITDDMIAQAREEAAAKKELPALPQVRVARYDEGLSAQIMHIGPYEAEAPTIARLHAYIEDNGYVPDGKHHEVYIGDPRRAAPERLRTVLRQPVREA